MCRIAQIWILSLNILKQSSLFAAFSHQWFNDHRTDWCFCPSVLTLASGILGYWTIAFTVSLWRSKESHQWFLVSSCVLNLEIPRTGNLSPPLKLDRWAALASRHRLRNVEDTLWHAATGPRRHRTSTIILSPCPWIKDRDGSSNSGAAKNGIHRSEKSSAN